MLRTEVEEYDKKVKDGTAPPRDASNPFGFTPLGLPKQLHVVYCSDKSSLWDFFPLLEKKVTVAIC